VLGPPPRAAVLTVAQPSPLVLSVGYFEALSRHNRYTCFLFTRKPSWMLLVERTLRRRHYQSFDPVEADSTRFYWKAHLNYRKVQLGANLCKALTYSQ
jgi:hypothetical protein